ncbi:MAG TPA: YceI family protein [Gemmatimonadaceae bacterium]|jgi:polyisoprenoid-binding protein YceI|nr:YceI family protein [Gemmatimonadaceae bacterium]
MTRRFLIQLVLVPALLTPMTAFAQSGPPQAARTERPLAAPSTWKIDPTHSELSFTIRHMVSKVRGQFDVWTGTIIADPSDWSTASVEVVAQTSTIDTNNERRDADLRSDNHFDADANPTVTFRSTKVTRLAGDSLTVAGNLTIHGITRPVVLRGHFNGMTGAPGKRRAGFDAETTINRKDFNMNWNRIVEGSAMVGDEVKIEIDIAAVEQPR